MGVGRAWFNRTLIGLTVLALAAGIAQPLAAQESVTSVRTDRWMGDLAPYIQDKKLTDIVIPGTHDSAAYWLDEHTLIPGILPQELTDFINKNGVAGTFIARFSLAHDRTIKQQLEDGIRYLDIRLTKHNGEIYAHHGLVGNKADVVFGDIEEFVEAAGHEKEIVILSVAFSNTPDADVQSYRQAILDRFGARVVPLTRRLVMNATGNMEYVNEPIPPIGDLWHAGRQVVFLGPAKTGQLDPGMWLESPWPNKWQEAELEAKVAENLRNGASDYVYSYGDPPVRTSVGLNARDRLFVLQAQATPDTFLLGLNLFDPFYVIAQCFNFNCISSLEALGKGVGKRMIDKVFDWWIFDQHNARANLNIVIADFYEHTTLVQEALAYNQPFAITPAAPTLFGRMGTDLRFPLTISNPAGGEYDLRASPGIVTFDGVNWSGRAEWLSLAPTKPNFTVIISATARLTTTVLGTASFDVSLSPAPADGTVTLWPSAQYQAPTAGRPYAHGAHPAVVGPVGSLAVGAGAVAVLHSCENFDDGFNPSYRVYEKDDSDLVDDPWPPGYCGDKAVARDSVSALWVLPKNCQPGPLQVALFDRPNFQGGCVLVGIGSFDNPRDAGLPNDFVGSARVGAQVSLEWWEHAQRLGAGGTLSPGAAAATLTYASGAPAVDVLSSLVVRSVDQLPPVVSLTVPAQLEATSSAGAAVPFTVAATDNVDGALTPTCTVAGIPVTSGVILPMGSHALICMATDAAGNEGSASANVFVVDRTPPAISLSITPDANAAGWHKHPVSVQWTITDLVGVTSSTGCDAVTLVNDTQGTVVTCVARDAAGNTSNRSVTVRLDRTAPTISFGAASPSANANGWHRSDVSMGYAFSDAGSGLVPGAPTGGTLAFTSEGAGQAQPVTVSDVAGNVASAASPAISIDKTPPQIAGSRSPLANAAGWNNTPVTVSFDCADALSGVEACSGPATLSGEGANQSQEGVARDRAGNTASATVSGINIDLTPPVVACSNSAPLVWPPNHGLVNIQTTVEVGGGASSANGFTLVSVTSSEPDSGLDADDLPGDIQGFTLGTADTSGQLRAERGPNGVGRTYSLVYAGFDLAGNRGTCTTTVFVPKTQGSGAKGNK